MISHAFSVVPKVGSVGAQFGAESSNLSVWAQFRLLRSAKHAFNAGMPGRTISPGRGEHRVVRIRESVNVLQANGGPRWIASKGRSYSSVEEHADRAQLRLAWSSQKEPGSSLAMCSSRKAVNWHLNLALLQHSFGRM